MEGHQITHDGFCLVAVLMLYEDTLPSKRRPNTHKLARGSRGLTTELFQQGGIGHPLFCIHCAREDALLCKLLNTCSTPWPVPDLWTEGLCADQLSETAPSQASIPNFAAKCCAISKGLGVQYWTFVDGSWEIALRSDE